MTCSCCSVGNSVAGSAASTEWGCAGAAHEWYIQASCSIGAAQYASSPRSASSRIRLRASVIVIT